MAVVVRRGKKREELEGGGRRTTARRGVEGNCGLKKKGENEKEKNKGGMEKSEWAEASTGVGLKEGRGGRKVCGGARKGGREKCREE